MTEQMNVIERAIDIAGSEVNLAKAMKVTKQAVRKWVKQVPAERVIALEEVTGISRHDIRPDLYPKDGGYDSAA